MLSRRNHRCDRGSALMLMPACVLVVVLLASIAVDMALVHLRQRQALDLAASAANDAATGGADAAVVRRGGFRLDPETARRVAQHAVAASDLAEHLTAPPRVLVEGETVEVELTVAADYLFADAIPGAPDGTTLTASASATAAAP